MASNGTTWPADAVQRVSVKSLVAYPTNARTHSAGQIDQLAASIREWGFTVPVLVDVSNTVIAGHGRLEAARQLGLDEVPVMVAKGWSAKQIKAYRLADNQLALNAAWDVKLLAAELGELTDLEQLVGFSDDELHTILNGRQALTDPDEIPARPEAATSKLGDLWICGRHRLLCGDATREDPVKQLMCENRADMIFTDPPYGVSYHGSGAAKGAIAGDITQTAIPLAFKQALEHATSKDARLYFCGGASNVQMYYSLFDAYLRRMPTLIVWDKANIVLRRNNYHSQYEVVFYGWRGKGGANEFWFGERKMENASDIWRIKRDNGEDYLHPTQKPAALAARAIVNSCPPGGFVYDPFLGSGTTMIAAEMEGRSALCLDIDPGYCDVAVQRWQDFTGEKATLDGTGEDFATVAAART
jgi:DNA modification methylase